jgi:hypothetical protein
MSNPLATAGVVMTPVEPVVVIESVKYASVAICISGFVPEILTKQMTNDGCHGRASLTSAGVPADVNVPVRN